MTGHDILCVHTMVGYLVSTDGYFRSGGWDGTESHWGIGGAWGPDLGGGMDGRLWQWQDMRYQADANLDGNPRVLSVETADNAPRSAADLEAWTPAQVNTLVRLCTWVTSPEAHARCPKHWACRREGIPRVLVPDSRPGRRGIAYHRQGCDPWRAEGGERWSSARGKVCPGDRRIRQLVDEVIPRVRAGGEEDDMPLNDADKDWIRKVVHDSEARLRGHVAAVSAAAARGVAVLVKGNGRYTDGRVTAPNHAAKWWAVDHRGAEHIQSRERAATLLMAGQLVADEGGEPFVWSQDQVDAQLDPDQLPNPNPGPGSAPVGGDAA